MKFEGKTSYSDWKCAGKLEYLYWGTACSWWMNSFKECSVSGLSWLSNRVANTSNFQAYKTTIWYLTELLVNISKLTW